MLMCGGGLDTVRMIGEVLVLLGLVVGCGSDGGHDSTDDAGAETIVVPDVVPEAGTDGDADADANGDASAEADADSDADERICQFVAEQRVSSPGLEARAPRLFLSADRLGVTYAEGPPAYASWLVWLEPDLSAPTAPVRMADIFANDNTLSVWNDGWLAVCDRGMFYALDADGSARTAPLDLSPDGDGTCDAISLVAGRMFISWRLNWSYLDSNCGRQAQFRLVGDDGAPFGDLMDLIPYSCCYCDRFATAATASDEGWLLAWSDLESSPAIAVARVTWAGERMEAAHVASGELRFIARSGERSALGYAQPWGVIWLQILDADLVPVGAPAALAGHVMQALVAGPGSGWLAGLVDWETVGRGRLLVEHLDADGVGKEPPLDLGEVPADWDQQVLSVVASGHTGFYVAFIADEESGEPGRRILVRHYGCLPDDGI